MHLLHNPARTGTGARADRGIGDSGQGDASGRALLHSELEAKDLEDGKQGFQSGLTILGESG